MKFKSKIFIAGLLLSVLPLILVSTIIISVYDEELNQIAINDLQSITTAQVKIIDNFFHERDVNLSILSEYPMLHKLLEKSNKNSGKLDSKYRQTIEEFFLVQKSKHNFVNSIAAMDMNFRIVACTEPTYSGEVSLLKKTDFLRKIGKDVWFSEVLEKGEKGNRNRCLVAIKAIYNEKEECIGYLTEEITLDFFENLRITTNLIKEGSIYISDGNGKIISAGIGNVQRKEYVTREDERGSFSKAWENRNLNSAIGVIKYNISGKNYLSSYGGFENADWDILTTVCLDDILHTRENILRVMGAAILLTALMLIAINFMMYKMLTHPIEQMIQTFAYIRKEKDFRGRIKNIPSNELGIIANEVNSLLNDIEVTIRHQEERLKILKECAERDSLTGLFNKNTIKEILNMKVENARVNKDLFAFVLVDIDDFKNYNTEFGHTGGDKIIQFVGVLMKEISCDTAGRIGGDEFVMCLDSHSTHDDVVSILEKFIKCLREGFDVCGDGTRTPVPCSIGVTRLSSQIEFNYEAIVDMADKAMYKVKNSSKNGYYIVTDNEGPY